MGGSNPTQQPSGTTISGMIAPNGVQQDVVLESTIPRKEVEPKMMMMQKRVEKKFEPLPKMENDFELLSKMENKPSMTPAEQEAAEYERLTKQGMSGESDQSPEHLARQLKSLGSDINSHIINPAMQGLAKMISGSQNGLGRDASQGAFKGTSQTKASINDITEGLK